MPTYTYRCPEHGDFTVEQAMADTRSHYLCVSPHPGASQPVPCPKVLGAAIHYPYGGRGAFHDGPDGTGETVRETATRWRDSAIARGLDPVPVGSRWV